MEVRRRAGCVHIGLAELGRKIIMDVRVVDADGLVLSHTVLNGAVEL